jgi:hypothetical protein
MKRNEQHEISFSKIFYLINKRTNTNDQYLINNSSNASYDEKALIWFESANRRAFQKTGLLLENLICFYLRLGKNGNHGG